MKKAFGLIALALVAGAANADIYTGGAGGAIPDNSPAGVSGLLTATNVGSPTISSFNSLTIRMGHTWAGDLVITLTSPAGTTADVIVRSGVTTATGFGNSGNFGSSSSSTAPGLADYTFVIGGGALTAVSGLIPAGTYGTFSAANGTVVAPGATGLSFAAFNGENLNGNWTLTARDLAAGDTGTIDSWSMDITSVPTPGALALVGLGGLVAARRRRA
jgi:MYXO-CTERM domain-containing protein